MHSTRGGQRPCAALQDQLAPRAENLGVLGGRGTTGERYEAGRDGADSDAGLVDDESELCEAFVRRAATQPDQYPDCGVDDFA